MRKAPVPGIIKTGLLIALSFGICFCAKVHAAEEENTETIVLAGGCFWGVEAVFEHTRGVIDAVSGYAGGEAGTARYDAVSGGGTGHAESVKVTYDPALISLDQLLDVYFTVAHDPTQLNYQGPDRGTQYRSAIFYAHDAQKEAALEKIADLGAKRVFPGAIVTKLEMLERFYPAEDYHQDYAERNPMQPYIKIHDAPKVERLKETHPDLYRRKK